MSTRADNYTQTQKTPDLFSDFLVDLTPHPITKDVARVKNDIAIKRAVRNLVLTNVTERLFQPNIGGNVKRVLFEPNDIIAASELEYQITNVINNNEPRVNVLQVQSQSNPDGNDIAVNIVFAIINSQTIQTVDLILRRIR
jgi:phage baseplate assembly protein W